ncbi:diflavin oxidoreductase [Sediminibacterium soli]|uniref:diflavin oxidoreductase n=1 Tax=Sediminibacterium soli TaxID=2698829 RepID=UPI001379B781|nr:flavodoxin domain-containing protein [Sediminibacterium soli]NCI46818.1 sulfite reductase [Sediminibacterium soli]
MLTGPKQKIWEEFAASCSKEELVWISGYLSGILSDVALLPSQAVKENAPALSKKMTVVYGTETGNAKKLATDLAARAKKKSLPVKLLSLDQYRVNDITKEENLFVVISTQGDGEPPAAAQKFYDHIHKNGFRLDNLKYSVLALGDTSYPFFCKTGEDVDQQLQKLGGRRIIPMRKCDVDYETDAEHWFEQVLQTFDTATAAAAPVVAVKPAAVAAQKSNKKIYRGTVLTHINLHDTDSPKETWHIELGIDEEVDCLPGDSIGIVPENTTALVEQIIGLANADREKTVKHKDHEYSVYDLLKKKLSLNYLHERVVKKYAEIVQQSIPETKMDLLDLLRIYPVTGGSQFEEVLQVLPAQSPRIYTIASSPAAHSGEVHLTVEKDVFLSGGQQKTGVCSEYFAGLHEDDAIEFFVQKNKRFRLPEADKDVLMIGPGTGVAAFRSFLSERDATGAGGRNWLFFGEDHFVSDFLYQTELQNWYETGVLNKLSLAFAKDRPYTRVHHKLLEQGREVFEWIENGAYLYVGGKKTPMSVDVEYILLTIIERYGGLSATDAAAYFENLKTTGRYNKDVY